MEVMNTRAGSKAGDAMAKVQHFPRVYPNAPFQCPRPGPHSITIKEENKQ